MVNRVVVGAHYGLRGWLVQRVSAVVMTVYAVVFGVALAAARPVDHAAWKALFAQGWMRLATLLFFASLFLHAWVGMRDILMDYVKPTGLRLALEVLVILVLVACAGWAVQILWRT
jgi:succinate dehydrogenase / fumarate reductase membrane anchor subunit